ncbi:MAG: hypothetical protein JWN04_4291 [Myxococcaceae bacterium]|nr:hypothetical protein [Myxococcaceae bacterium]
MADVSDGERDGVLRKPGAVRDLWNKYGLIVVGNVVFFALLYFIQYRPNSRDSRATELLTLAQREEAEQHLEAAESVYSKILAEYRDSGAGAVARERLPKVLALAKKKREAQAPLPAACAPTIKIKELLETKPSLYLAELVAGHYPEVQPAERERYFKTLDDYVWLALNRDKLPLDKLRKSPVFKASELQLRYFALAASVRFEPDWMYDDFKIKNTSYFTLHNAVIDLTVKQGDKTEHESVRVAELAPEAELDVLELNVAAGGGEVQIKGKISADEGKAEWDQRL